jgi:protein TonB
MFDYATRPRRSGRSLVPTMVSAVSHTGVLVALAISALSAAEVLPPPPDMMAFVVAPAPPPPPPPAADPPPPKSRTVAVRQPPPVVPVPPRAAVAAPVEAPAGISPETGLEGDAPAIEPGFEAGVAGGISGGIPGGIAAAVGPPSPPPPPPPTPVRVGGDLSAPRLVRRVNPEYPAVARQAQIEGVVILEAVVDGRGRVEDVKVLRGHPLLDAAAMQAVREWRYEPLRLNGQPTPFVLTVTVSFRLG